MTSIGLKIPNSWYASKGRRVQELEPWVWFSGGRSIGQKLAEHCKNIEQCAHRAATPPSGELVSLVLVTTSMYLGLL